MVDFNWQAVAEEVVEQELFFLERMNHTVATPEVVFIGGVQSAPYEKANGEIVEGYACGKYSTNTNTITIYADSIALLMDGDMDKFKEKVTDTLAHEFQHHVQFTGTRKKHFINANLEDRAQNVPYVSRCVEINAREAAAWFVQRRKPIHIQF